MDPVTDYLRKARSSTLTAFQQAYPHFFLYKHPRVVKKERREFDSDIDYATRTIDLNFDPMPGEAQLVAVKKNPENPFPDRLTIGRATNCDVVVRFAFVSKVHAHLFIQGGDKLTLRDNNSSNATFHNHRKLEAGSTRSVKLGDILSFGALDLELADAARIYEILRASHAAGTAAPSGSRG